MSQNHSFCEISIDKDKKIKWIIDLSKNENSKKSPSKKTEYKPNTLYELAQNYINQLNSYLEQEVPPQPEKKTSKTIRKLAKKIMKTKKLRLSEVAAELNLPKNNIKHWLLKGENLPEDNTDYETLFKNWILDYRKYLSQDDLYDVINRFNKSLRKTLIKSDPRLAEKDDNELIEDVIIDNRFPLKKVRSQEAETSSSSYLNLVRVNVHESGIHIKDTLLWNINDSDLMTIQQFAKVMVKDYVEDHRLNPPDEVLKSLIKKITKQIIEEVEVLKKIKNHVETLIKFNANTTSYKQKETVIKITLLIKEDGYNIKDTFDWEIDPKLNDPEGFARQYVIDNGLPPHFTLIISSQIRKQINDYLQKRLKHFASLYGPILTNDIREDNRKLSEALKQNILHSLTETLDALPLTPPQSTSTIFLKNQDMFNLVNKYVDYLNPTHKAIFLQQKSLIENEGKPKKSEPASQVIPPLQMKPGVISQPIIQNPMTMTSSIPGPMMQNLNRLPAMPTFPNTGPINFDMMKMPANPINQFGQGPRIMNPYPTNIMPGNTNLVSPSLEQSQGMDIQSPINSTPGQDALSPVTQGGSFQNFPINNNDKQNFFSND